ncbi:uncharacterized protein LOC122063249 [Macadamia integrifolia]|uniref:uncharacterized protein LOC122063249 n=1 Tax=Macadamia integrifolia TaxID=60698 RepID=UPI001C4F7D31|nr:uncharacterized protein LOC122063249 [Macadamia integrifolia]XP_042482884.1 uncharacterized protein LOC122063249 [Macadamia integrifolia]
MTSHQPAEIDSGIGDSVTLSPRSEYPLPPLSQRQHDELQPRVRFMCSFGGRILPRPHDNQLRYVGGDTRIVTVNSTTKFSPLFAKLSKLSGTIDITIKYQLPNEDLDALATVSTDEDVENMMEEYDRVTHGPSSKTARLRLFLFPINVSSSSSLSSIIDIQSKRVREQWFFDVLNGGVGVGVVSTTHSLDRGRSEVSSIVSEVPDYLFGFDNSDESCEPKSKGTPALTENVSVSDPGSPPSVTSIPDLPPVKTKIEDSKESRIDAIKETGEQPISWQYFPASHFPGTAIRQIPVYYFPHPVPPGKVPAAVVPVSATYVQRFPVGFPHAVQGVGQVYGGEAYEYPPAATGVIPEVLNQQAYYAARNQGVIPSYTAAAVVPASPDLQATTTETKTGRVWQPQ